MNNSYKLFDISWDGCHCPAKKPIFIKQLPSDINGGKIYFSDVLKSGLIKEKDDESITKYLIVDYIPQNKTPCVIAYYAKRLLQIINQINNSLCVCEDSNDQKILSEMMDIIYSNKVV